MDMALIDDIRIKVRTDQFEFTRHAVDRSILRKVHVTEIREAIESGEIIENYPEDKYGPSCLILGFTRVGRPLHIQITHTSSLILKLITCYEPDPVEWIEHRVRR